MRRKTHKEFVQQMKEKQPEIEILGQYIRDNIFIEVKHIEFDNHIWKATPSNLLKGTSCPYCSNKKPLKGFNTFGDYYPELICLFKNSGDAYKYTYGSGEKIKVICPDCGIEKEISLNDLRISGISCQVCKDSVSIPNKFIRNIILLKQNILEDFKFEYHPKWAIYYNSLYKYDVYFIYKEKSYIIEMNGLQHKTNKWGGKEIKNNDEIKKKLAKENGIDYYIEIESYESTLNYLRNNFNQTILKDIFILTEEEWKQIGLRMNRSILVEICKYYNDNPGLKIQQIADYFHIHHTTVTKYLLKGKEIGICVYNKGLTRGNNILVKDLNNNKQFIFTSVAKCILGLNFYYKEKFNKAGISQALHKQRNNYKGLYFQYLNEINDIYIENKIMRPKGIKIELYKNNNFIGVYDSLSEAQRKTGISKDTLSAWIKGKRKSKNGYTVKVIEQDYL